MALTDKQRGVLRGMALEALLARLHARRPLAHSASAATFYPSILMSLVLAIGWVHGVLVSW